MRRTLMILTMIATAGLIAACNTVEGAGRDLQSAGDAVEDAAK